MAPFSNVWTLDSVFKCIRFDQRSLSCGQKAKAYRKVCVQLKRISVDGAVGNLLPRVDDLRKGSPMMIFLKGQVWNRVREITCFGLKTGKGFKKRANPPPPPQKKKKKKKKKNHHEEHPSSLTVIWMPRFPSMQYPLLIYLCINIKQLKHLFLRAYMEHWIFIAIILFK